MSSDNNKNVDIPPQKGEISSPDVPITVATSEISSTIGSVKVSKSQQQRFSSTSERQIKFERAQKCLENAALVSKRIKEHRKATAELLGKPFEDDELGDTGSELASTMSERTGYSAATDTSTTLSVQEALNIPGISESLANTLKQKELLMERIKHYKEISKRPVVKSSIVSKRESGGDLSDEKQVKDKHLTQAIVKGKENTISILQVKMKAMESTIMDLQEKLGEKDMIIEAKTKATTLMSDSLTKKEKDSLTLLEDTRHQMVKMQENFLAMETEWKKEKQQLLDELETKNKTINHLEEAKSVLENSKLEISLSHSKLEEQLNAKNKEIIELQNQLQKFTLIQTFEAPIYQEKNIEEEKGSLEISNMVELTKRVELLEQLNCQIRQTNKELENKLASLNFDSKTLGSSPKKGQSPVPTRKSGRNTASKLKSPWSNLSDSTQDSEKKQVKNEPHKFETVVQSLNKEILDKEYIISQKDSLIQELQDSVSEKEILINTLKETVSEKDVYIENFTTNVASERETTEHEKVSETLVSNISEPILVSEDLLMKVNDLETNLEKAQMQISTLNEEIDVANKNMIKVKSNNKIKTKQMQKTIDNFSKMSDVNTEIIKLNEEVQQLTQKVAELEEEKGNLQLHLVDYDSGRLTESESYRKLVELESLAESRFKAISSLEAQKFDLVQELHVLQQKNIEMEDKLADMSHLQSEHVCTEIQSVQLEEELDKLLSHKKELELFNDNLKLDKEQMSNTIMLLEKEKEEICRKLEHYIQDNIDLTDKLEKLSAEKVSSAESIEIVESLTTQEKIELEEYNKGVLADNSDVHQSDDYQVSRDELNDSIRKLTEESAELNKKIELFSTERQEVMEKMNKINSENETLQSEILQLTKEMGVLHNNIDILSNEKQQLHELNVDLNNQIEELTREKLDIMKETSNLAKSVITVEDMTDSVVAESQQDEKSEKGSKGTKSVKQLTKDILKLKNVIKEREEEIADCQMKILSLEEQHQKQTELVQSNAIFEAKLKAITDERTQLLEEISNFKQDKEKERDNILLIDEIKQIKQSNEALHLELSKLHNEYNTTVLTRDSRIQELENLLNEYENQMYNYNNTLQVKDKELTDYINQITKLNDVSQKLKSTIEMLEEEKANDQNTELIKSLNKKISIYQNTLTEYEEKIKVLENEKSQLLSMQSILENENSNNDIEMLKLKETLTEKQTIIKELQQQQHKYDEDINAVKNQVKERDEEIHDLKLQLRKESIENEKLRAELSEKIRCLEIESKNLEEITKKLEAATNNNNSIQEQYIDMETKNKELLEKLKKFAITLKKKSNMYIELEVQFNELQKLLQTKEEKLENISSDMKEMTELRKKITQLEEELKQIQSQNHHIEEQKYKEILQLRNEIQSLTESIGVNNCELTKCHDENSLLNQQNINLNKKLIELEMEQKNNMNLVTKVANLETEIIHKQEHIQELVNKIDNLEQNFNQVQFGHNAKVQERDLYIENLESEIYKYKSRIARLEESISEMEDRRQSLERKADQLDVQLQEKYKAYNEYFNQEDELVNRLAVLMDHDRVVEKQLHEIEKDNKELQQKIQNVNEDNIRLKKIISDIQNMNETLVEKASKTDCLETQVTFYQENVRELEGHLKKITGEHQSIVTKNKQAIEDLESEFNTQIGNAIKEKKMLSEKYEKTNENVMRLEQRLQEYKTNIDNLNINLDEITKLNQILREESAYTEKDHVSDYTEQYITEINKLNSIINAKNNEIIQLTDNARVIQLRDLTLQNELTDLQNKLVDSSTEITKLINEIELMKTTIEILNQNLYDKEDLIKQLKEKKTMAFEMNIPKTEGMIISSKIEEICAQPAPKTFDIRSIESQIVSDITESESPVSNYPQSKHMIKAFEPDTGSQFSTKDEVKRDSEPVIVAKKAYLCYQDTETPEIEENVMGYGTENTDPFNSVEGWGFDESGAGSSVVIPDFSHHNEKILKLKVENEKLQSDLEANNMKFVKAMKKLKDLKKSNDMLSNELKISKQLSQPTLLDNAIEDELKLQIKELETKIEDLQKKLNVEKRENDLIKKQNEIFNNANDKLTEMKEKLDSEVELWKFKFKEVNDKMSTLEWGAEGNEGSRSKTNIMLENKEDLIILEKENDDLHSQLDLITKQNNDLNRTLSKLQEEYSCLKEKQLQKVVCNNCNILDERIQKLISGNQELLTQNESLKLKLLELENAHKDVMEKYINSTEEKQQFEDNIQKLTVNVNELNKTCETLKTQLEGANSDIKTLEFELKNSQQKFLTLEELNKTIELPGKNCEIEENYDSLNKQYEIMKVNLEQCNQMKNSLEVNVDELTNKATLYEQQFNDMNNKIHNLNTENDQLLTTVAELRSSVSDAVDQRGYEIAEMWKQHLSQREAEFMRVEQDLREQLIASESKYEQILDSVQSSSQEETNKLVMLEQINTLQIKLKDKEEHLLNLQNKSGEIVNQLELLRSEMEDERTIHENNLLTQREEYENQILEQTMQHKSYVNTSNEDAVKLQRELTLSKEENDKITCELSELKNILNELENKIADMTEQMCSKDNEIYQKTNDFTISLSQRHEEFENARKLLVQYEKKLEDLTYEKESELAILRLKLHENLTYYENQQKDFENEKSDLIETLNTKVTECMKLNKDITELNQNIEDNATKLIEMQTALENQEIEIVTLKDEVINLENLLKMSANKIEKHVTFSADTKAGSEDTSARQDSIYRDQLDPVPRAELDLALYMLHQRDVRCEELTMELTQLLEERDTLQLRLSDSLRSFEDLRVKCKSAGLNVISTTSEEVLLENPSVSSEKDQPFVDVHRPQTSRSSSVSEGDVEKTNLHAKLTELRSLKHNRDVRLRQDSEQRQMDMRLLQRDIANLPPEAAEQLRQAHHTLSRDTQSTSTVLLNWLRGKSTPKVVQDM